MLKRTSRKHLFDRNKRFAYFVHRIRLFCACGSIGFGVWGKSYSPKSAHANLKRRKTHCQRKFAHPNGLFGFAVLIAQIARLTNVS